MPYTPITSKTSPSWVLGLNFGPNTQQFKIYNPTFYIKMHKNAKTFLNSTIYTYLCKRLGRDWVLGSLAMPRLGPKLGSGEVYREVANRLI